MSVEENRRLYRRWFEEVVSGGDLALADELLAADYRLHSRGCRTRSIGRGTSSS